VRCVGGVCVQVVSRGGRGIGMDWGGVELIPRENGYMHIGIACLMESDRAVILSAFRLPRWTLQDRVSVRSGTRYAMQWPPHYTILAFYLRGKY
jgi:hypothetical protein